LFNRVNQLLIISPLFLLFSFSYNSTLFQKINTNCLWIKAESILDTASVDSIITFSLENDIDKLFYQVRSRGDALYSSQLVSRYEKLDSLFDPLDYVIKQTSNIDIEIHAWFNSYILWSSEKAPQDSTHLYYNCNDCFAVDLNGKSDKSIMENKFHSSDWEGVFLSPLNPKVNDYLLDVILELVNNYEIDGIHLDYIRYQDNFYGYNKYGIQEFENIFSINPIDIKRGIISTRFGYEQSYVDSMKNSWDQFKIDKITEFIRSIKYSIISDSLDLQLSAAVKPDILEAKFRWYQDWTSWIDEELLDFCVVMNYYTDFNKFNSVNRIISTEIKNKNRVNIGISVFNQSQNSISNKIMYSRLNGYDNFTLFPYDLNKDTTNWYKPVYKTLNFYIE